MRLLNDWKEILFRAWSVRFLLLAALVQSAQVSLPLVNAAWNLPPKLYAILTLIFTALAIVARFIPQKSLMSFRRDESGCIRRRTVAPLAAVSIAAVVAFAGPWEGLRTAAYIDPVGVPTVCYGETKGVKIGDKYTPAECDAMLARRVDEFRDRLAGCITVEVPEGVAVVFVDWSYNIGIGAACRSTLARKANRGDLFGACDELLRWNKGRINGKLQVINGLANRREAERDLCVKSLIDAGYSRPAR